MTFQISGLDPAPFRHLYGLSDEELAVHGAKRYVANVKPGFPDRVEVRDAEPGETLLLLNYVHQPADTPYRASHAIFVREGADQAYSAVDVIPDALKVRPISLRAFNDAGEMLDADLVDGEDLMPLIDRFLANDKVTYLQAHYAKRGCYAARIDRVPSDAQSPIERIDTFDRRHAMVSLEALRRSMSSKTRLRSMPHR